MVWRHGKLLASSEMCGDIGEKWELVMRSKGCEVLGGFCVDMGAKRAKNWANLCKPMHFLSQNLCKPMQIYALIAETPCLCSPPGWICWLRGNHTTDSVPCQGRRRGDSGGSAHILLSSQQNDTLLPHLYSAHKRTTTFLPLDSTTVKIL